MAKSSLSKTAAERHREWVAKNIEHVRESRRLYYKANRERAIEKAKEWAANNPSKCRASKQRYADKNAEYNRERAKQRRIEHASECAAETAHWRANNATHKAALNKRWKVNNPHKVAASRVARRVKEVKATPAWTTREALERMYLDAIERSRATGVQHHVDHIVPLRSKIVSGLHCEANLRIVSQLENLRKGNRYWPDMP